MATHSSSNPRRKFRLAVVDRAGLSGDFETLARAESWPVEVLSCRSALEIVGDSGPGPLGGLVISVAASGPFLTDLLRWTESNATQRVPTLLIGTGRPEDEAAARMILGREHVKWLDADPERKALSEWLVAALEVHEVRAFRSEHDSIAQAIREARMQLFHGFVQSYAPPEGPPCGPPLPTTTDEIQPLREARAQFERAHIQAAVREWGSLKDASAALGISYTSLWRRLR
ncbi:MAG: helix-turn-helix domain-containing protein [Myxococcota bacterium]